MTVLATEFDAPESVFRRRARSLALPWLLLLPLAVTVAVQGFAWPAVPAEGEKGALAGLIDGRVDPNAAPWWELAAIPRIGEVTARRIVEYRESRVAAGAGDAVFRRAEDLDDVRGIGPKTVERVRPFLRFDTSNKPLSP